MEYSKQRAYLWLIVPSLVVSFLAFAYPIYVIRPFRRQGPRELAAALAVIQIRPTVEIICAALALIGLLWCLRTQQTRSRRIWTVAGASFVCLFAVLSYVNVYELMFHPDARPSFAAAQKARIDPDDKVIAVKLGAESHAYPIRSIGYHHIINDVVNGEPIVATY